MPMSESKNLDWDVVMTGGRRGEERRGKGWGGGSVGEDNWMKLKGEGCEKYG